MSMSELLTSLFRYKAWANEELLENLNALDDEKYSAERRTALLLLNHAHIVDRIFVANLQRMTHSFSTPGTADAPPLAELSKSVRETDLWYIKYVSSLNAQALAEHIEFTFTDGAAGRMSREEMLAHVITHGCYHRGEVGRILAQLAIARPRDIFTGFLHKTEPSRRERHLGSGGAWPC